MAKSTIGGADTTSAARCLLRVVLDREVVLLVQRRRCVAMRRLMVLLMVLLWLIRLRTPGFGVVLLVVVLVVVVVAVAAAAGSGAEFDPIAAGPSCYGYGVGYLGLAGCDAGRWGREVPGGGRRFGRGREGRRQELAVLQDGRGIGSLELRCCGRWITGRAPSACGAFQRS